LEDNADTRLPQGSQLREVTGTPLEAFRVVLTDEQDDRTFLESFESNAVLGEQPRGFEITHPLLHIGISTYQTRDAAEEKARQFPKLGRFVARLVLPSDAGITYARWGGRGHMTIWAEASRLVCCVAEVTPVSE